MYGKKHTSETKSKISRTAIKRGNNKGGRNPNFGKRGTGLYVYHPLQNIRKIINKKELDVYLISGWLKGMGIKRKMTLEQKTKIKNSLIKYHKGLKNETLAS